MIAPKIKAIASKVIQKFGREVTLVSVSQTGYDPDTGESSTSTESTITAFLSAYKYRDYNENIIMGDIPLMTVSAVEKDDRIKIDSKIYAITNVSIIPLESEKVLYEANLRAVG